MKNALLRAMTVCAMLLIAQFGFAQKITVTGHVVDASDGQPLIGVGVVPSTGGGTITDYDGNYMIKVEKNAILTFSTLGYVTANEAVDGRTVINVSLSPDTEALEEVVVLGYTTQKKTELSSAVVSVSGEKLHDVTSSDVGNMLQGKVAGVVVSNSSGQPGQEAAIRIRGTGSISAGAGPMYVVDGVAGGSFNPNDVETLTVLKDASATALYGAAAAGGVIVVTTKTAKTDKATVNFKGTFGIKKALTGRFKPMDSEELYWTQKTMYGKAFKANRPAGEALLDQDFSWIDHAFRTGLVQNYYASVSGKSGRTNYFVSLDHYDEQGSLINTRYKRNSARVNLSTAITDNLTMNARVSYKNTFSQEESSYVTLECAYRALPWDIPYVIDADGNWTDEVLLVNSPKRSDNGEPWYSHDKYNVLHNELYNYSKGRGESIVGDIQFNWNITDWLTFNSTTRYDSSNDFWESYIDPRTQSPSYANDGHLSNSDGEWNGWGTTNILKFHKVLGTAHDFNAIGGWEYGEGYSRSMGAEGKNMPAGQRSLSNCAPSTIEAEGYDYHSRTWALLSQAQYSYLGKYIVTASLRYDESYKFGANARGGFFPGVSGAWIISKEDFLSNVPDVSLLKVRAGYGKTGNDNIAAFKYQDLYELAANYEGITAAVLTQQANPNLGWEEAYMTSFGIDATFKNHINMTLDLYNTLNTNLLLAVPTSPATGFYVFMAIVGIARNRGIEFAIDGNIILTKNLVWNAGFNIGLNKNTVVELPGHEDILQTTSSGYNQKISEGRDIYSWFIPKWVGVDPANGDPLWEHVEYDADGNITKQENTNDYSQATPQFVGTASPKFTGGLNTSISWKGLTLSANGSFIVGNKVFNYTRCVMDSDGAYPDYNQMSHDNGLGWVIWDKDDDSTWDIATHPKLVLNGNKNSNKPSSRQLEDGSFFRLRNVTLSYDLPAKLLNKAKMSSARVFLSGDNLFTLTKFSGMDPEVRLEGSQYYLAGSYSNNYPVPMSISLGIDVKF